jgi:hypothetical protein
MNQWIILQKIHPKNMNLKKRIIKTHLINNNWKKSIHSIEKRFLSSELYFTTIKEWKVYNKPKITQSISHTRTFNPFMLKMFQKQMFLVNDHKNEEKKCNP